MPVLRAGAGFRPGGRVPFCVRQKGTFALARGGTHIAKQCEWRPKSASADLPDAERQALRALILDELRRLHEGVLARYGLRPSQLQAWKDAQGW